MALPSKCQHSSRNAELSSLLNCSWPWHLKMLTKCKAPSLLDVALALASQKCHQSRGSENFPGRDWQNYRGRWTCWSSRLKCPAVLVAKRRTVVMGREERGERRQERGGEREGRKRREERGKEERKRREETGDRREETGDRRQEKGKRKGERRQREDRGERRGGQRRQEREREEKGEREERGRALTETLLKGLKGA